ncbi:MAG: hypothetical protein AMXMBFR53_14270 [Gemmatimonadota bacterium]
MDTPHGPAAEAPETPPGRPGRRRVRWGRGFLLLLFVGGLLVGGTGAALVKSRPGQRFVLDAALDRVRGALAGDLTVEAIHSGSLLTGATLVGVRLDAEGGRRFLEADSVRVGYSVLSLFGSVPRVVSLTLFGPRVEISRYPGEDAVNASRLAAPRPPGADSTRGRGIVLARVRVVDGLLEVLTPVDGAAPSRVPVVPSPTGEGSLRRLSLEGVDLELDDVLLGGPGGDLLAGRLASLAMDVHVLDRPLTVTRLEGALRFGRDGLALTEAIVGFPASPFDATLTLGPRGGEGEGWGFALDLRTQGPASLADLAWLDERVPEGVFRGRLGLTVADGLQVSLDDVRVELEASRLALNGAIGVDDGPVLRDLEIQASPLAVARLSPWLERDLPVDGFLSGNLRLSGRPAALAADGRVTLVPVGYGGLPTTADLRGTFHFSRAWGVTNLEATLDPMNLALVQALRPALALSGSGRGRVEASGRVDDGVRFVADLTHGDAAATVSRILAQGSARRGGADGWVLDVQGDLSPLSLELLHQVAPAFATVGGVEGSLRAVGPLADLRVSGDLGVAEGRLSVEGRVDLTRPGEAYRLDATVDDVRISRVLASLPDPSRWSGRLQVEGRGLTLDSLEAAGTLVALQSRVGGLHVDSLRGRVRVSAGVLAVDTVSGRLGGLRVDGAGDVGLVGGSTGRARIAFETDDVVGLRSLLMGDTVMARDTLSVLERQLLRLQGVDADTLPLLSEVAMAGALTGFVELQGSLSALDAFGEVHLRDGVYGADSVGVADIVVTARDVTGPGRALDLDVEATDLVAFDRSLARLGAMVRLEGRRGEGSVAAVQTTGERYDAEGAFELDSLWSGGTVRLNDATVDVDSLAWNLREPATIRWDSTSVTLENVRLTREGADPMLVRADGTLAWAGSSDLHVEAEGLHLDRVARLLQRDEWALGGHMDLSLQVSGPAARPVIEGRFTVEEPRYQDLALGRLTGELSYADREADVRVEALGGGRPVFRASGTVPVDLALRPEGRRVVPRSMDVRVVADSLDASLALSPLGFLEGVEGRVSGEFRLRGPLDRPEPSGVLRLEHGGWAIEALGVRHAGVRGALTLNPDRTVDVEVDGEAVGVSHVRGRVVLDPITDPRLDLRVGFEGFQAVDRRDVTGLMSGEVRLVGTYRSPRVEGALSVDQGVLYLEEFVRSAEIVDLTDPRIFQVVDTTALSTRPLLAGIRNPFLQHLRVDVDLAVPRDTWLRSEDMNVEIGGELLVRYDRLNRDVVMVGELEALRGTYTVLGRRFDVRGGTVGFIGTPGINPTLEIDAVTRVRRSEGLHLDVTATVAGTLTQPRVTLSSEEQGVAESDLVSYLIFGRPTSELATGQEAFLRGAAGSGVSFLSGTVAARLGAAISQQIGVDYLSISQAGDFGVASSGTVAGSLAGTTVEVGQYVGDDVFIVLIFRPLSGQTTNQSFFGGARVEVALTDDYNVQGFWEDRFLRSRAGGFGDLGIQASQVIGVFIFREWGY